MALTRIPGQERAVARLEAALRCGRTSHAYLLVGPAGVGRLDLARELAAALLCREGEAGKCDRCESCRALAAGTHPDYEEVGVQEGAQKIKLEQIRRDPKKPEKAPGIQDVAALKPLVSARRVFVIRDAENMTPEAANCFLKTLEEPPGGACFILIAAGLWDLPETIVSRCQVVKLAGLPAALVREFLNRDGVSQDDAWWLAHRTWGSPGLARAFAQMGLPALNRELAEAVLELGPEGVMRLTDRLCEQAGRGEESRRPSRPLVQELLECLVLLYRDAAVITVAGDEVELFNTALREPLEAFAARCSADLLIDCTDRVLDAIDRIGGNANITLALDDLFAALARPAESRGPRA
ncbi:MAG: hypothetical protein QGH74_01865 [Candidatus Brocadiia bacterium]|jgi:DNA polymerase-3 subunit delta'|nr:hypothetical protein [Candidatus Brocadiia bacterium]